jgi:gliding motility-associated-like protein
VKTYFRFFLFLTFIISFSQKIRATHVPGGNITYENIGPNTFVITLTVFEDCGTAFMGSTPQTVMVSNNCGLSSPNINLPNVVFQDEVSQLCLQMIGQSECNGGGFPGVYMHVWRDTITLPGGCDSWVFAWDGCCRNTSVNASGGSNNYYWETVLNSVTAPTNSSPVITSQPIPYNCNNQPVVYNFGVYEPDGDSLHYSLISAMTGPNGNVPYNAGYSGASPINGININPVTGEITFTPTILGNFVVAVLIEEFDSNGNLVGSIIQDFQFEIISCTNIGPSPPTGGITNFSGTAILTGPFDIQACEGDSICFEMVFTDNNASDSVYVNSNISQLFPGATMSQNSYFSPVTATFCMAVLPGANPFSTISVTVNDNACPIIGTTSSAIGVTVISSTYAGLDFTMCQGVGTPLNATGGSNFNWSIITGDPISIGNNFSCNGCPNPVANPAFTTIYKVVSNLSGGCTNIDTVEVTVVPDFNYTLTQSGNTTCLNSSIQFNTVPSPSGNYTYQWDPPNFLSNSNIADPEFNSSMPGLFDYEVTITSNLGCVKKDTLNVDVYPAYSPDITLTANDTNILCGDTVFMNVALGGGVPALCGPSGATSCNAPTSFQNIGTNNGTNGQFAYPAPFGHYYKNAKQQYLFKASELQAAGFSGGKITEIAWETVSQNGATSNFYGFTIRMGCTNLNSINTWQSGLSTVFSPQNINVAMGWNDFQLTTAYEWDGISNLIVEICFNNLNNGTYTYNWSTPYKITPYNSAIYYRSDLTAACPFSGAPTGVENKRPVTRFKTCPTIPDPNNFTFQWTPPSFISSTTDQNPYAIPMVSTNYTVVATDLNGGCTDTASIFISALCDTCDKPIPIVDGLTCYGGSDASISGVPDGIDGPPWIIQLMDASYVNTFAVDSNVISSFLFDSLSAGSYVVRSLDTAGCYADTMIIIPDGVPMVLSMSNDTIICIGGTATVGVTATGGTLPYSYSWNGISGNGPHDVSPTYSQYYKVSVVDSFNCVSDFDSVLVALNPPIIINPSSDTTVCPYDSLDISVTTFGGNGGPYNYSWTMDNGMSIGSQSSINVSPVSSSTYYYLTISDNCETPESSDSILVSWYDLPTVDFSADTTSGCWPVEVYFYNNTAVSQVASCDWDLGNGFYSNNLDTVVTIYNTPGSYHVTLDITNSDGCSNDTTYFNYIDVYEYPVAGFTSRPNPASILNPSVQFVDTSSADVVYFDWTFYDSTNTMIGSDYVQNPIYNFSGLIEQQYYIELYVENQNGCSDTVYGTQIVEGEYAFFLPNSFTPNGDGLNDSFFPVGDKISVENYSFKIFNRWGELIFSTNDFNEKWDGTYQNNALSSDAYIWKIDLVDSQSGEEKSLKGYVLLSR